MKITEIRATPVRVPVKRVGHFAQARRTHAERTVVQIRTDAGLTGLGETRTLAAAGLIAECFAPRLLGQACDDLAQLRLRCLPGQLDYGYPEIFTWWNAYSAIDMALWDLRGKQCQAPLCHMLGGIYRPRAPFVAYEYTVDPEAGASEADVPAQMAENAARAIAEQGTRYLEFKVGVYSVECDIATVRSVRERLGEGIEIGADANMAFDLDAARRFLTGVRPARLANIEEPVANLGQMEMLAREFGVPVSTHLFALDTIHAHPGINGIVIEPHALGGILPMRSFVDVVTGIGRRAWFRSVWELGISWAAMCHMHASFQPLSRPSQSLFNWIADDLIVEDDLQVTSGGVTVPLRPGLGVTLDHAALDLYQVDRPEISP